MANKKFKCSASLSVGKQPKGVSILYTSVMYAVSDSGIVPPTSWSQSILQMTEKYPYLWTRTIVKYSDGTTTTSYSVSALGNRGPAGTSVKILGSFNSLSELSTVKNPSIGDGYIINGVLWSYSGKSNNNYGFVETGKVQGPAGKDAITIVVTPSTIVFDADADGTFFSHRSENDGLGEEKYFQVLIYQGNVDISKDCEFAISDCENFTEYNEDDNSYYVTIDKGYGSVYTGGINFKEYTFDGLHVSKPCSEAWIKINVSYNKTTYIAQVNVSVQVSAFLSKISYDNKKLLSKYTEISTNYVSQSTFQQKAGEITAKVEKNSTQIGGLAKQYETNANNISELTLTSNKIKGVVEEHQTKIDTINGTLKSSSDKIASLETNVNGITGTVQSHETEINEVTKLAKTNKSNIATLTTTSKAVSAVVESQSKSINDLNGKAATYENKIAKLEVTSNGLTSSVKKTVGDNILRGQNGIGWSDNVEFSSDGPSYKLSKSSEWYTAPAFKDYNGDCILSFNKWGDGDILVYIYAFDQTYNYLANYDVAIDKKTYDPNMTILKTSYKYTTSDILKYSTAGYVGTWEVNSVEGISVGDKVALMVFDINTNAPKHIYASVKEINGTAKTVKAESIDLLYTAQLIISGASTAVVYDDTEVGKMHYDKELDRYWIRFREKSSSNKTFLLRFKPKTDGDNYIARVMVEDSVEKPHKYMDGFAETQSMIRQTSEEIVQQVGDTFVRIGDGNITLNGDTQVNGSLTLNSEDQGFILVGDHGKTEISPKSIGEYSNFKAKTSHVIKTNVSNYATYGSQIVDGSNIYFFQWTTQQVLGKIKKGVDLIISNFKQMCYYENGDIACTPSTELSVYENDVLKKNIHIPGVQKDDVIRYSVTADSAVKIVARTTGHNIYFDSSNLNPRIRQIDKIPLLKMKTLLLSISWDNTLPLNDAYMLIGYDGLAINFGDSSNIFIGKNEFIANYGGHEIRITKDGIFKRNGRNVLLIQGDGTTDSPISGTVEEPVDTVLCTATNAKVIFPKDPYEGQVLKIYDKCPTNCYINSNGQRVVWYNGYGSGATYTNQELEGRTVWQFTYMNKRWYAERTT